MTDDDETARVVAEVPTDAKRIAKEKLPYGGISREIQDLIDRIAYGEDVGERSRLDREIEDINRKLQDARERRREEDARIETLEERKAAAENKRDKLSTRDEKYEAKIEELEARLRGDGMNVSTGHGAVQRAAETKGVDPAEVVETLKERNPDVPAYAFEDALQNRETWDGFGPERAALPVEKRDL